MVRATLVAMKVLRGLRTVVVAPVFLVGTLVACAAVFATSIIKHDSPLIDSIVRVWSRGFLALAGSQLTIEGRENIDPARQFLFIANHLSNLDVPLMFLATEMPIRYLAKAELFKIPVLKQAMKAMGIVKVDRIGGAAIHSDVNSGVVAATDRGHSLIIFPEGTRSMTGQMGPFKKGAFRIAIANGLDIIPVTISGTWESWRPGSKLVMGGPVEAVVHEPISVHGLELNDINTLRERVHKVIMTEFETHEGRGPH